MRQGARHSAGPADEMDSKGISDDDLQMSDQMMALTDGGFL